MSALKSLVAATLASAALSGIAYARDASFTAKLETPVAEQTRVIALNTIWNCIEDTCRARARHAATVRSCRQFVREVGARVVAYGAAGSELSADEIARCNGDVQTTIQARN